MNVYLFCIHFCVHSELDLYRDWLSETLKERDYLEDQGIDGSVILKWVLKKEDRGTWPGLMWLKKGTNAQ